MLVLLLVMAAMTIAVCRAPRAERQTIAHAHAVQAAHRARMGL